MAEKLWPRLWHVRLSLSLIGPTNHRAALLSDSAHRALMELVATCAAGLVWTYTPPGDGSLPDDDVVLARIARVGPRKWKRIRSELEPFFRIRKGRWHLTEEWIEIDDRPVRAAIPVAIQRQVLSRQGKACSYCGDTEGPFDFDHILPVSRGGSDDASNLTLACATCNRSKGGRTLREWFGR